MPTLHAMCFALTAQESNASKSVEGIHSGFHFIWHSTSTLEAFVKIANDLSGDTAVQETSPPKSSAWISQARGSITPDIFQMNLLLHVAEIGGGLQHDNLLITPNTSVEAYNISRLGHIEMHPFMQACMARLPEKVHFVSVMRGF